MTSVANGELRYQPWDLLWFHSCLINSSCLLLSSVSMCWRCVPGAQAPVLGKAFVSDSSGRVSLWLRASLLKCSLPISALVRPGLCLSRWLTNYMWTQVVLCMTTGCSYLGHSTPVQCWQMFTPNSASAHVLSTQNHAPEHHYRSGLTPPGNTGLLLLHLCPLLDLISKQWVASRCSMHLSIDGTWLG